MFSKDWLLSALKRIVVKSSLDKYRKILLSSFRKKNEYKSIKSDFVIFPLHSKILKKRFCKLCCESSIIDNIKSSFEL